MRDNAMTIKTMSASTAAKFTPRYISRSHSLSDNLERNVGTSRIHPFPYLHSVYTGTPHFDFLLDYTECEILPHQIIYNSPIRTLEKNKQEY